jgi:hypothetical protein
LWIVSTETYQAQYRVLEAFSLFNVILGKFESISWSISFLSSAVWAFLLLLLALAVKHHYRVNRNVWYIAVTNYPWFGKGISQSKLPAPISSRSRSRGRTYNDKGSEPWGYDARGGDSRYPGWSSQGHNAPARAHTVDKYKRNASPRR